MTTSRFFFHGLNVNDDNKIPANSRIITHRVAFVESFVLWKASNLGHLLIDSYASVFLSQLNLDLNITKDIQIISVNGIVKGAILFLKPQSINKY
jgi:hypothetical protein